MPKSDYLQLVPKAEMLDVGYPICSNNDIYFRHIFPNTRFWYSAILPAQQWNANQGENVSMIAIKVAIKSSNKPKITSGTSGRAERVGLIPQGNVWVITMVSCVTSIGNSESIYSRSIALCHQERATHGHQVVLAPLQMGIKSNKVGEWASHYGDV